VKVERRHLRHLALAPARRAVRLVALSNLQQAESAFARLSTNADKEALHDFRVALRRLRTHVRNYRPWLRESVERKHERRLRRIARASNPSRDLEVLIEQLSELVVKTDLERAGVARLQQRFLAQMLEAIEEFRAEALQAFPPLSRELRLGLSTYRQPLQLESGRREMLGPLARRLTDRLLDELRQALSAVLTVEHQEEAHEARIAGKRLRYLLEPFAPQHEACAVAVTLLKQFQDALGCLHDCHVLMTEAETALAGAEPGQQPALAAVLERVQERRLAQFAEVRRDYLESNAALLIDGVHLAQRELARGSRTHEIERKFLLKRMPRLPHAEALNIQQGYLPGTDIRERVRSIESKEGRTYFRTLKAGLGASRLEIEEETTERIFKRLFALTKGQRVRKRRYVMEDNGLRWEIDRFLDRKLVLAEVELEHEDQPIEFPRWLKSLIVRDVTNEADYTNERLAR
jgi:CHAD domain-containing protein/CYTH domain-containing protein